MNAKLFTDGKIKCFRSDDYNYNFSLLNGEFQRWGKTLDDDPQQSPFPEILDIETSVNGCPRGSKSGKICNFCYKGNTVSTPSYMSFETFKKIIDKFPKIDGVHCLTQIAAGITSFNANPDLFKIFEYCRQLNIVPNLTISGRDTLTDEQIDKLLKLIGAAAFSVYPDDKDQCYDLIHRFISKGLKQTNIHYMVSLESYPFLMELLKDIQNDDRLKGLNAIVFLGLKPKGRGNSYHILPYDKYNELINYCFENNIRFGFDSCSSPKVEKSVIENKTITENLKNQVLSCCERCESLCFSYYINVNGISFPCSFAEGKESGTNMLELNDFNKDAWDSNTSIDWRNRLHSLKRECPIYKEIRI